MKLNRIASLIALASLPLIAVGCGEGGDRSANAPAETPSWVLTSAPSDASSVAEVRATAAEGDRVILRARIGGRKVPIEATSPVFVVMDLAVPHCGEIPGDGCGTPWDYCCETPESIAANAATIRVEGDTSPAAHGFAALDEVIVVGVVGPRPNDTVLSVDATGIYRVPADN